MGKFKMGNPKPSVKQVHQIDNIQDILDAHVHTFRRLAESEAKEKEVPLATMLPTSVETHVVHTKEIKVTQDHRARRYAKALNKSLADSISKSLVLHNKRHDLNVNSIKFLNEAHQIQQSKLSDLEHKVKELELRKPEEKQVVIEKAITPNYIKIGLCVSLLLNVLILLINK